MLRKMNLIHPEMLFYSKYNINLKHVGLSYVTDTYFSYKSNIAHFAISLTYISEFETTLNEITNEKVDILFCTFIILATFFNCSVQ